ncbi:MAG: PQQ-dependent sugar dehydrogenase [Balneolaceae bacterium]|nr:MAG: PQQ-dependent sugar dehydrogenase [Balneolaceae bacterium]
MEKLFYLLAVSLLFLTISCAEQPSVETAETWGPREYRTQYQDIRVTKIAGGLERPWAVAFLPDGRFLVTERPGSLVIVDNGEITPVSGTPSVKAVNQGGMMEVVTHPDYEENGWIYLTYSRENEEGDTAVAVVRGRLNGTEFTDLEEIFVQNQFSSPGRHYGSKIAFDNEGVMYVSIGDRGANPPRAQDNSDHAGTLLRMYDDGSIPADNPFVNDPDVADEIFSFGHRNIQGLIINQENNEIWATEHGPRGGDELNFVEEGLNYGWPDASLGMSYGDETRFHDGTVARSIEGMVDPVYEFLPTLAPAGLALVTSDRFPRWQGNLLAGGLQPERIRRLLIMDGEVIHDEELLTFEIGRIRDVREGPDGNIYVVTDENPGGLYVIEPAD